ncbi:MAG TPA: hypothetical protein VFZ59_11950 [Verrucomicrobiae bacterium]|nr:hypothetical protein [Verrucomicrobiae bacterium]
MKNLPKHTHLPEDADDPDNLGDDEAVKALALDMLQDASYWHAKIRRIFASAGIATRSIVRMEVHPIWECRLTLESFDLSLDKKTAIRQLRKVLRDGGIKVVCDEFNIVDRRGDKLHCVFMLAVGAPSVA